MEKELKLGKEMKDKITGFTGIATSKHEYLTGCTQYALQPKTQKDGKLADVGYFDESRLEVTGKGIDVSDLNIVEDGCDNRERP